MGRKRTACHMCRSIKALCSAGLPCTRCQRLSLSCQYATSTTVSTGAASTAGGDSHTSSSRQPRSQPTDDKVSRKTKHRKSATGCLDCRRRRKKCDEKLPKCTDCERLHLGCTYSRTLASISSPPSTAGSGHGDNSTALLLSALEAVVSPNTGAVDDTVIASAQSTLITPAAALLASSSDPFELWTAFVGLDGSHLHTQLSSAPNWLAWLTLLETDLSILETEGRVETTRRSLASNTAAVDLGQIRPGDDDLMLATFFPPTALSNLTGVTPQALTSWSVGERHLLNHFLQSVSRILVVVEDSVNPFLRVIVPMALGNAAVRHALVALSGSHLSRVFPDFENDVWVHRFLAHQELMTQLDAGGSQDDLVHALAVMVLLCLAEICIGSSRKWLLYLHGARSLLTQAEDRLNSASYSHLSTLGDMYNYIATMAAITDDNAPAAWGSLLQAHLCIAFPTTLQNGLIHPLFGISESLYKSLAQVNCLAAYSRQQDTTTARTYSGPTPEDMELAIQSWEPPDIAADQPQHVTEARAVAFAVQWAAIMRLLQVTRRLQNDNAQIRKASDNILSALSLIRPGSPMEAHLLFPLFMAGVGSMTKASRLTVEYRLNGMETNVGLGSIVVAHRLLDEIWRMANLGELVEWEDLMRNKYPGLVLV